MKAKNFQAPKSLQTIAGDWHGGQSSALYAYASAGQVMSGLTQEIVSCFSLARAKEKTDLQRLYVAVAPVPSKEDILNASEFWHRLSRNADNSPARCRKSGKLQVWKTRPTEFKQPVKHGLKDSFYLTPANISDWVVSPE